MARLAAYIKKGTGLIRNMEKENSELDMMIFENKNVVLVGLYNPFKLFENGTRGSNFESIITKLYELSDTSNGKELIVVGDFNVDWKKSSAQKKALVEWSQHSGLSQIITEITRYRIVTTEDGQRSESSILDHVYIPHRMKKETEISQIPTPWTDHELLKISYPNLIVQHELKKKIKLREWRNYKKDTLLEWLTINPRNKTKIDSLIRDIEYYMEEEIPYRVIRYKPQYGQVPSTKIAKRTKKRDRQLKKFKRTGDIAYLQYAQRLSKQIKKIIRREQKVKIQTKLETPNPKTFWHTNP